MSTKPEVAVPYLGAQMRMVNDWVWNRIIAATTDAGFDDLNPAHIALFRYPGPEGRRPSTLAAHFLITKQSVNDLLSHLDERGYLTREPDPDDGRARVIKLTPPGKRLVSVVRDAAKECEDRMADVLGPERFHNLKEAMGALDVLVAEDRPIPTVVHPG
jgi:DNA-binding MarR family transcriptional regulator